MPKRNKRKTAVVVTDGTEHAAHILFTDLVVCERVGDIFHAGGRSNGYERRGAMTYEYVLALLGGLGHLVAEYEAERGIKRPALDDIMLEPTGNGAIRFTLFRGGVIAGSDTVTQGVGYKAKVFLDTLFDGPKVVRMRKKG